MLRPVDDSYAEPLLGVRNHPSVIGSTALSSEMTLERMNVQIERWLDVWGVRSAGTWVIHREGIVIGYVPLDPMGEGYQDVDPNDLEIGVVIHPDHWGNGYAGEAGLAVAVDCFARTEMEQLYATVDDDNDQSLAVLAKAPQVELLSQIDGELLYRLPNPSL